MSREAARPVLLMMRFRGVMRTGCEATLTSRLCMPGSRADRTKTWCCTADVNVACACSIFEDEAVAELLTTGKLSELAVLTLYLMCASRHPQLCAEAQRSSTHHCLYCP